MPKFNGFKGDYFGLTSEEVAKLQEKHGYNEIVPEKKENILHKILHVFEEPMFILLFVAAAVYFFLGEPRDGTTMLVFVVVIAAIEMFQEWRTDKTLKALKDLSAQRVRVIRNGELEDVDSRLLCVGDIFIVEEGEKIPADGEIVEMFDLGIDESILTGESEVVWKKLEVVQEEQEAHWRRDRCYASTMVTQGTAIIKVTSIGLETEYGKIGLDVASVESEPTPLEKQTRWLVKVCAVIGFVLFVMVFLVTYLHSGSVVSGILSGVTLAMAMIPEEFPVVLTIFLSMGAWRLANKNSLIRRMPSVETLGSVTVLCVDKTGTLTMNQMAVRDTWTKPDTGHGVLLEVAGLACETEPFDPMEKAILEYVQVHHINKEELFDKELLFEYPFSSETKMMGHVWEVGGKPYLTAKGSPESILPLCMLDDTQKNIIDDFQNSMSEKGLRVIAVAHRNGFDTIPEELSENRLDFVGLIGLADPPRESVPDSIRLCKGAGIRVVMITGDNGVTARSIACQIGLDNCDDVVTGKQIDNMGDEQLRDAVRHANIFARVIPRHKLRIVKALKQNGEIAAMTGDGVNDAPALKYSDIGVAMGMRGTGVAREASDMILLDDNFTTIVDTVRDGRRIYDNIRKAIGYIFVIHIPIALMALVVPLMHMPLMLLPIHIVLLELVIDSTCSIVFERQPAEKNIMERPPRNPKEPLVTKNLMAKSILQGLAIFAAAFGSYYYLLQGGSSENEARTFALAVMIISNIILVYVNQSSTEYAVAGIVNFIKDKVIWTINIAVAAMLLTIIYFPPANEIARTVPLEPLKLMYAVAVAGVATLWWEIAKALTRE
ncbi:MAG: HAD-IC family P-type ATPase [Peptoclostridium sp.]|uniref:cation-translocating P-type ATPase n=1 Tax=Peptoclostridium sp. TaxID=1904860 RepID=UPI00139ECE1F|nr:cation-translocating P-type ATPase [Peptoclostridium sp.]MZQ75493.1 HAD-IC family P-type ATPase [Peptoclostridium sp.]